MKEEVNRHLKFAIQIMEHPSANKRSKSLLFEAVVLLKDVRYRSALFVGQFRRNGNTLTGEHANDSLAQHLASLAQEIALQAAFDTTCT